MAEPQPDSKVQPYSKAERLLNLLMALRGTQVGLDREQIRSVVRGYSPEASAEAFERMFERDKDELRAMGVPVATLTDASGVVTGYRIEGDWALPPLDLSRAELAAARAGGAGVAACRPGTCRAQCPAQGRGPARDALLRAGRGSDRRACRWTHRPLHALIDACGHSHGRHLRVPQGPGWGDRAASRAALGHRLVAGALVPRRLRHRP